MQLTEPRSIYRRPISSFTWLTYHHRDIDIYVYTIISLISSSVCLVGRLYTLYNLLCRCQCQPNSDRSSHSLTKVHKLWAILRCSDEDLCSVTRHAYGNFLLSPSIIGYNTIIPKQCPSALIHSTIDKFPIRHRITDYIYWNRFANKHQHTLFHYFPICVLVLAIIN